MRNASRALVEMGATAALVKGGHLRDGEVTDLLWDGMAEYSWSRPRVDTDQTHGTGCTLSAAVAAGLAKGMTLAQAVDLAIDFIARAIATAPNLGQGHGPVNHFVTADPAAEDPSA
jgi:hydroxymethylpyrimidine kinase/phosphomethylpyrimidine kinase